MAEGSQTIISSCLCGATIHNIVVAEADLPLKVYICHCTSCRHATGTLSMTMAALPPAYAPSETMLQHLTAYQFSKRITQYHCRKCGTQTYMRIRYNEEVTAWGIKTGSLQSFDSVCVVEGHEHVADTLDGGMCDFLPSLNGTSLGRWAGHFQKGEQTPLYWRSPETTHVVPTPSDRLHAHCHCGGINFWITRPSEASNLPQKFVDRSYSSWPDLTIPYHTDPQPPPPRQAWWTIKTKEGPTKYLAGMCSCDSCRLGSGVEIVQWAFIPTTDIFRDRACTKSYTLDIGGTTTFGTLQWYRSSQGSTRGFCKNCGSHAILAIHERPEVLDVGVGILDAPEGARAENWLSWHLDRLSYREDARERAGYLVAGIENGYKLFKEQHN